ncbi:MAG: hypothetical protein UY60_C0010G0027 [Parcubacteria group bacterium GW2011_GWB1_50_9]|uniref:Uncharacterized protein n=1 Tax=Candidatus Adlerbacteria bacterium GW2011_GWC1_50_9 TaxID=1618608 RepID=A0A0G1WNL5_9BACT|nr:MAG: hypothetical protein UY60_C0010G0027 [Parcubacteria group bacterium GW2011_GWB1_50_9]KKW20386.1 MAG: hypothetical protein UY61_C0035G0004 [Candidatus Adlerbacteria bacterium GW2011_GWC1_50_9]
MHKSRSVTTGHIRNYPFIPLFSVPRSPIKMHLINPPRYNWKPCSFRARRKAASKKINGSPGFTPLEIFSNRQGSGCNGVHKKERLRPLILPARENPSLFPALPRWIPYEWARHVVACARRIDDDRLAITQRLVGKDPKKPQCAEPEQKPRRNSMSVLAIRIMTMITVPSPVRKRWRE